MRKSNLKNSIIFVYIIVLVTLVSCQSPANNNIILEEKDMPIISTATENVPLTIDLTQEPLNKSDEWVEDVIYLAENLVKIHPDLFFSTSKTDFDKKINKLIKVIPNLTDDQIIIEMLKIVASIKDGHTLIFPFQKEIGFQLFPLRLYLFEDGMYVIDSLPPYEHLIGTKLIKINDNEIDGVLTLLSSTISNDNQHTIDMILPIRVLSPEMIWGLEIEKYGKLPTYVFENFSGETISQELIPISYLEYRDWVRPNRSDLNGVPFDFDEITYLSGFPQSNSVISLSKKYEENFWFTQLDNSNTLYFQYNFVFDSTPSGLSMYEFVIELENYIIENDIKYFILDIRHNPGGNNGAYSSLLRFLQTNELFEDSGNLSIIIGRNTFSAATNFVTAVEKSTNAIFFGEGTGGSPNLYGDTRSITLPNSKVKINVSTRYWQISTVDDQRDTLTPDFYVSFTSDDYFSGIDPYMDFIINTFE